MTKCKIAFRCLVILLDGLGRITDGTQEIKQMKWQ